MAYTNNKQLPKIRREAAKLVRDGWSTRKVARHFGYSQSVIVKWAAKAREIGNHPIPTKSSRPKSHPKALKESIVQKIVEKRLKRHRYAEAIHKELANDGVVVSLSSVKRTLDRTYLLKKKSLWKRYHPHQERPQALKAGALVELDAIHIMTGKKIRIYVLTLIDVYSRIAYAKSYQRINAATALQFVHEAQRALQFRFTMLQTDHGSEFGPWFVSRVKIAHRYTRLGKPNDNAHIERFNRTLQEECLDQERNDVALLNKALKPYLNYYNYERLHGGILFRAPHELLSK